MKILKKLTALLLCALLLCAPLTAFADSTSFTCYGDDLSSEQYQKVLDLLGSDYANDTFIPVTIDDERALLGHVVSADKIGSRSLSSARVTLQPEGSGIQVETHNINWVTPSMYSSALITAGVQNAKIVVAAPVEVSGTAALAGILKAYESASAEEISDLARSVAGSEMVLTGELSDAIGSEEAVELLAMVKQAIADYNLDDYDTLRPYVEQGAYQLGVQLTDDQIDQITELGVKFAQLDFDPQQLSQQLSGIVDNLQKIRLAQEKTLSLLDQLTQLVQKLLDWFNNLFGINLSACSQLFHSLQGMFSFFPSFPCYNLLINHV